MQILAGAHKRLKWQDGEFVADADGDWVIKSLDYFVYQELYGLAAGVEFQMGICARGLVGVPEGATVAEFLAAPLPMFVNPLAAAVMEHTRGN